MIKQFTLRRIDRLPETIKALRTDAGMTQDTLAKLSGKRSPGYIAQKEGGSRGISIDDMVSIARASGWDVEIVFKRRDVELTPFTQNSHSC